MLPERNKRHLQGHNFSDAKLIFCFCVPVGVLRKFFSGFLCHHFECGMSAFPCPFSKRAFAHFFNLFCGIIEIAAINMQRVTYVDISADGYGFVDFTGYLVSYYSLQVGQCVDIHKPGFVKVSASPMSVHIEGQSAILVFYQSAPYSLKAGGVIGLRVSRRHPGYGLCAAGVADFREPVDNVLDLIYFFERFR